MSVRSWDIFDTLIARRCIEPVQILLQVQQRSGFSNFTQLRTSAERLSNGTFDDIYDKFQQLSGCSASIRNELQTLEFTIEQEQVFFITEIADQITDGDILVSDMYLSPVQIRELLSYAGFTKNVKIYVSYAGKFHGWVWKHIEVPVKQHCGDNYYSDVVRPRCYGISTQYFNQAAPTPNEKYLRSNGLSKLAEVIREIRLKNPYSPQSGQYYMWREQCQINLPLLYLASIILHDYVIQNNIHTLLFATRDSIHWQRIYAQMFPDENTAYFHASRQIFYSPTEHYTQYVKSTITDMDRTVFIDVHGTGKSATHYFSTHFGKVPHLFIISATPFHPFTALRCIGQSNSDHIEMLNYDQIGTLRSYDENGPVRSAPEYDVNIIQPYHQCVDLFIQHLPLPVGSAKTGACQYFIRASTSPLAIQKYIRHCRNHPSSLLP